MSSSNSIRFHICTLMALKGCCFGFCSPLTLVNVVPERRNLLFFLSVLLGLVKEKKLHENKGSLPGMTVKVHVWAKSPYWRARVFSTLGDTVRELTLPSFWMDFRATPFSHMFVFSLKECVIENVYPTNGKRNVSSHGKGGNL